MDGVIKITDFEIEKSGVFNNVEFLEDVLSKPGQKCPYAERYYALLILIIELGGELENYNKYKESVNNG